jgi:nucleotide-binding universal stress UspA family protein
MIPVKNVLVAVDFGDVSDAALTYARNFARSFGARLHLLHVMENRFLRPIANDPSVVENATTQQLLDRLPEHERMSLQAVAAVRRSDEPADEIVQYARLEQIDLIVLGTHGRTGLAHLLLGSVAERVVRTAPCPVMTVRGPDREFVTAAANREVDHDRPQEHPGGH